MSCSIGAQTLKMLSAHVNDAVRSPLAAASLRHVASTKWERRRYLSMGAQPNPAKQEAAA